MARMARVVVPGIPHHIVQRGIRNMDVFFKTDDHQQYLNILDEQCQLHGVEIWAYCLMTNHIHLIAVPKTEASLAQAIGRTHWHYTRSINFREGWRGYLWQGRFSSYVMNEAHTLVAARYIEQNPVKAGLCNEPWEYRWSSAMEHIDADSNGLLNVNALLDLSGGGSWKDFISNEVEDEDGLEIRKHCGSGRPLGDEEFVVSLENSLNRRLRRNKTGPKGPHKRKVL
jgi:putative transposase